MNDDEKQQFDSPADKAGNSGATGQQGFEEPTESGLGSQADEQEMQALASELPADITALKAEIEDSLLSTAKESVGVQNLDTPEINGVGFAYASAEEITSGLAANVEPGQLALKVYTTERLATEGIQAALASIAGTRALSSLPVIQAPVGVIDAQPHRFRIRPAPGGVSVGHYKITAGTLGCLAIGLRAPRDGRLMVLSNNHVLANSNDARIGDCICQPGPADGGKCPADQIAILESFVPINFSGGINYVDAATGWAWPDRVRRELVYLSGSTPVFFRVGAAPVSPSINLVVGKTGRTTQLRQGRITAVGVTVNVNYGGGRVAQFRDQFAVRAASGDFSAGGDSGSLVWQWSNRAPVGLLFAGGGGTTFCNRITRVLSALDVRLYV